MPQSKDGWAETKKANPTSDKFSGDPRHNLGALAEAVALEILIKNGWYAFIPFRKTGPIDLYAVHPSGMELKLDVKTDRFRPPHANRRKPTRIHRKLTQVQKELGVFIAYSDVHKKTLHISRGNRSTPIRLE